MTFNSLQYLAFLPVVVILYRLFPRRGRQWLLLVASYVFYGAWDWRFLGLLAVSTLTDYTVGRRLAVTEEGRSRRLLLLVSLVVNLGILATFKYYGFFVDGLQDLLASAGLEPNLGTLELVLPVGISFYTFQTLGYTIDVYRRDVEACRDPVVFAVYVAYFPQLVAGPIERANRLIPQLERVETELDATRVTSSLALILGGLTKKVVLADQLAPIVDQAFSGESTTTVSAIVGAVAFAGQIYGDFSGYTDIARGSSRLLGVELVTNFREPYLSLSITDFWRRWHMSLSQWLRDYLYIPLGGNRGSRFATSRNLMITMLLGGLWHGAAWTFVVWGGLHGLYLLVERLLGIDHRRWRWWQQPFALLWTFSLVLFAWVFFRSPDIQSAWEYLGGLFEWGGWDLPAGDWAWFVLATAGLLAHDLIRPHLHRNSVLRRPILFGLAGGAAIVAIVVVSGGTSVPFIYFQF